ncbi:MAG: DUF1254 domain-containing protein [Pseudomonadota bacterium]
MKAIQNLIAGAMAAVIIGATGGVEASQRAELTERERAEYDHAYTIAVQAAIYGWAPVMMDVARELQTSVDAPRNNGQAPINELGPITRLWDSRDRSYATPNNDTLYLQGWADLEEQPQVLYVPPIEDRYWMQQILDMYTESVVDLCNATVGTAGGYFVLAKTGFTGKIPDDLPVYYSPTRYIWLAGRLGVANNADQAAAREIQKQFRLMPLDAYPNGGVQPEPVVAEGAPEVVFPEGVAWFERPDEVLRDNPLASDEVLTEQFEFIGVGTGGVADLNPIRRSALNAAFPDAFHIVFDAAKYSDTPVNGWNWEYEAGRYGNDFLQRAAVNMNSVGLNSPVRAMYPKRYVDQDGRPLNGKHRYEITMPADMPVREAVGGFWSMTMYDAVDRFMVDNEINRHKIGTTTEGLVRNPDGTLTITLSHEMPEDPKARANWLPAPDDNFMLQIRLYEPEAAVVAGEFVLPQLYRIDE